MIKSLNKKITKRFARKTYNPDRLYVISGLIQQETDEDIIIRLWKAFFCTALIEIYKFNTSAAEEMFNWGSDDHNWEKLHSTDEILSIADFKSEVNYISDRISLDRLFRTHWMINQLMLDKRLKELY
jgi:hypothetical protein